MGKEGLFQKNRAEGHYIKKEKHGPLSCLNINIIFQAILLLRPFEACFYSVSKRSCLQLHFHLPKLLIDMAWSAYWLFHFVLICSAPFPRFPFSVPCSPNRREITSQYKK